VKQKAAITSIFRSFLRPSVMLLVQDGVLSAFELFTCTS